MEAMKIEETLRDALMNSKSELGSKSVPRVIIEEERDRDSGTGAGGTKRIFKERDTPSGQGRQTKRKRTSETRNSTNDWSQTNISPSNSD